MGVFYFPQTLVILLCERTRITGTAASALVAQAMLDTGVFIFPAAKGGTYLAYPVRGGFRVLKVRGS